MKPLKEFSIQFLGLKSGENCFEYKIDKKFFDFFEYKEFNDVNVNSTVVLNKKTTFLEFHFRAFGTVNIYCDLTNEPYNQEIDNSFDLVVNFGNEYNDDNEEILIIPHSEHEINIAQYIYELIVLSMPARRIHPGIKDGTLNSEILDKLEELSPKTGLENINEDKEIDPRWNTLKKLLTDK
ncbi:MAG: DUF177 domain-containing protein [Flavobacteriaceae bacterium]|nr:DUF177 domain-containing protein [Flavobacteriaceae bacterium]